MLLYEVPDSPKSTWKPYKYFKHFKIFRGQFFNPAVLQLEPDWLTVLPDWLTVLPDWLTVLLKCLSSQGSANNSPTRKICSEGAQLLLVLKSTRKSKFGRFRGIFQWNAPKYQYWVAARRAPKLRNTTRTSKHPVLHFLIESGHHSLPNKQLRSILGWL